MADPRGGMRGLSPLLEKLGKSDFLWTGITLKGNTEFFLVFTLVFREILGARHLTMTENFQFSFRKILKISVNNPPNF